MSKLNANSVEMGSLTTAQRDALSSVATGTIILNTTVNEFQIYTGSGWVKVSAVESLSVTQSSGTNTTATRGGYRVHTFTSPGTLSVSGGTTGLTNVELLVVAGGGGGGGEKYGAGGGGGGVSFTAGMTLSPGTYSITVGPGGSGGAPGGNAGTRGTSGSDSSFGPPAGAPSPLYRLAVGGGGGGSGYTPSAQGPGGSGGSGGGAGAPGGGASGGPSTQPSQNPGKPGTNFGNVGGTYGNIPSGYAPCGGGGAGFQGGGVDFHISYGGGAGGDGAGFMVRGYLEYFGAGGAGSVFNLPYSRPINATKDGYGGQGGGGTSNARIPGNEFGASPSVNGVANSGGGGAGSHYQPDNRSTTSGGSGGSGIVIVAYPTVENR